MVTLCMSSLIRQSRVTMYWDTITKHTSTCRTLSTDSLAVLPPRPRAHGGDTIFMHHTIVLMVSGTQMLQVQQAKPCQRPAPRSRVTFDAGTMAGIPTASAVSTIPLKSVDG